MPSGVSEDQFGFQQDVARFARGASEPEPPELSGLPRPIAGYCGELGTWFDTPLVARLARERPQA